MNLSTSSSCKLQIRVNGKLVFDAISAFLHARQPEALIVDAEANIEFLLTRLDGTKRLRVRLGREVIASIYDETEKKIESKQWLINDLGESCLEIEEENEYEAGLYTTIINVPFFIRALPEIERDFRVMIGDLNKIHMGLAHDVISRGYLKGSIHASESSNFLPTEIIKRLQNLQYQLTEAIIQISAQPSKILEKRITYATYRAGDHIDISNMSSVVHRRNNFFDESGRAIAINRLLVSRPFLSEDIPEHRHIAQGVKYLKRQAAAIHDYFEHTIDYLYEDKNRWGERDKEKISVFDQRCLPKIGELKKYASAAKKTESELEKLLDAHSFLKTAQRPRTSLGPTPIFCSRPAYMEAYKALIEMRKHLGVLVDGDSIRYSYKNLATLFEYWCFIKSVQHLRARFGPPEPDGTYKMVHDIYRPDLKPGQSFTFSIKANVKLKVIYEPEILPWRVAFDEFERYGATLTREPLRPDILLEITDGENPPAIMVLDAKSTSKFDNKKLRELSDYSRQVFEITTDYQPVRQVFLLHRDSERKSVNMPDYFEAKRGLMHTSIVGGIPCIPEYVGCTPIWLSRALDRFIEIFSH